MPATTTPPDPAGRAPADARLIDVKTVRATIDQALTAGPLPRYEDLVDFERLLRGHIDLMLPLASTQIDGLQHGTVEWHGQRSCLDLIRAHLAEGLGHGLSSAHIHVKQLAHDCRALLRYVPGATGDGALLSPLRDTRGA